MPARNATKRYEQDSYYHVYNRGAGKGVIFIDDEDRSYFLHLLARYLDPNNHERRGDNNPYPKFDTDLLCYCLMPNHFHLLFYLSDDTAAISEAMRSILAAYTMYFNLRYKRSGHLFQGVYKASHIDTDSYLMHISRYIHMNPADYTANPWSSIKYFQGKKAPGWLHPERILELTPNYDEFLRDYEDYKRWLEGGKDIT